MQSMQLREVDVATVHDVESTSLRHQHAEDVDLVPLAAADVNDAGYVAAQVEQGMIFTAALVVRNGAHGSTDKQRSMVVAYTVLDRSTPKDSSA